MSAYFKNFFAVFLYFFVTLNTASADGLMVTPTRVELNNDNRTQEIKLVNKSDKVTTYRISFQNLRMKSDGSYEEITESNIGAEKFADKYIKYSPKRISLNPGEVQTIRILADIPTEAGEYRSHLLFKEEESVDVGNNIENTKSKKSSISVSIKPVFAVSIPLIIKNGNLSGQLTIEDIKIISENGKSFASIKLNRAGNESVYGGLTINNFAKEGDDKKEIGVLKNISVYYPYDSRTVVIPLTINDPKGIIEVKFYSKFDGLNEIKRGSLLAKKEISIQ